MNIDNIRLQATEKFGQVIKFEDNTLLIKRDNPTFKDRAYMTIKCMRDGNGFYWGHYDLPYPVALEDFNSRLLD